MKLYSNKYLNLIVTIYKINHKIIWFLLSSSKSKTQIQIQNNPKKVQKNPIITILLHHNLYLFRYKNHNLINKEKKKKKRSKTIN